MKKILGSMILGAVLLTPVSLLAQEHTWNDGESAAWHQYLKENHRKYHDWNKANKREQAAYWKWRDNHRDIH